MFIAPLLVLNNLVSDCRIQVHDTYLKKEISKRRSTLDMKLHRMLCNYTTTYNLFFRFVNVLYYFQIPCDKMIHIDLILS